MLTRIHPGSLDVKSVLIASDFSPASERALRHALAIARNFDAELHLVHVVTPSPGFAMDGPDGTEQAIDRSVRIASGIERRLICSGAMGGLRYRSIVRVGNVWSELLQVIRRESIDLVVIGTRARNGIRRVALGSVAEQIFRQASCPVLTIGPSGPPDARLGSGIVQRPLLFVTDFSDASLAALPFAVSIAKRRGAQLVLAHILSPETLIEGNPLGPEEATGRMRAAAEGAALERLRQLTEPAELIAEPLLFAELAAPVAGILKIAGETNAELIVMGLGRRRYIEAGLPLPWSIACQIVCRARCPVLTVRSYSP